MHYFEESPFLKPAAVVKLSRRAHFSRRLCVRTLKVLQWRVEMMENSSWAQASAALWSDIWAHKTFWGAILSLQPPLHLCLTHSVVTAVRFWNTRNDVRDYITFPDRHRDFSWATTRQKWVLCIIAMATDGLFHHEGGKNVTRFWLGEEWSDGLFTTEEEEKENKSRKSPRNKQADASSAVISHCYVTFNGSTGNHRVPLMRNGAVCWGHVSEVKVCLSVHVSLQTGITLFRVGIAASAQRAGFSLLLKESARFHLWTYDVITIRGIFTLLLSP